MGHDRFPLNQHGDRRNEKELWSTTIERRIARRMVLNKQETRESYAHFLRGHAKERDALYSDALISVTVFFRNPEAFDAVKRTVFPKLLAERGEALHAWVPGCSTGQEAYSLAMAFVEAAENRGGMPRLQVFATDLNEALLDKARHGLYAKNLAQDISPERLRRFFVEEEGGFRVAKALREMIVFAICQSPSFPCGPEEKCGLRAASGWLPMIARPSALVDWTP